MYTKEIEKSNIDRVISWEIEGQKVTKKYNL